MTLFTPTFAKSTAAVLPVPPPPPPAALAAAAELLCFCAAAHSYRMKYYVLRHNVVSRVHALLQSRRGSWLRLAPLRFVRACVGLRDEFYDRYLARNGLLAPLLEAANAEAAKAKEAEDK